MWLQISASVSHSVRNDVKCGYKICLVLTNRYPIDPEFGYRFRFVLDALLPIHTTEDTYLV